MTHCIYTGAKVWLEHDNSIRPADIYAVGSDHVVVRFNTECAGGWPSAAYPDVAQERGATHLVFRHHSPKGDWFRQDLGVLVTSRPHCVGEYHE